MSGAKGQLLERLSSALEGGAPSPPAAAKAPARARAPRGPPTGSRAPHGKDQGQLGPPSQAQVHGWSNEQLREELRRRGLPTSGAKAQLVGRLLAALPEAETAHPAADAAGVPVPAARVLAGPAAEREAPTARADTAGAPEPVGPAPAKEQAAEVEREAPSAPADAASTAELVEPTPGEEQEAEAVADVPELAYQSKARQLLGTYAPALCSLAPCRLGLCRPPRLPCALPAIP